MINNQGDQIGEKQLTSITIYYINTIANTLITIPVLVGLAFAFTYIVIPIA